MSNEGLKKRDIQRAIQKVHLGTSVSSNILDGSNLTDKLQIGFAAEKLTIVTTGDLVANVQPKIGNANANAVIAATTTPSTTTTGNMFSSVEISRTSGSGVVIILAK